MAKGKTKVKDAAVLDNRPPEKPYLAVRNVSPAVQVIPAQLREPMPDLVLNLWEEQLLPPEWAESPSLRRALQNGVVSAQWVDAGHTALRVPTAEEAPADAVPDTYLDRAVAVDIVLSDTPNALEMLTQKVELSPGRPDVRYLQERFAKIIAWVKWAEPQVQNRPNILRAADERLREIKAL